MLFICINFPRQAGKDVTSRDSFWRSLPRPYASVYGLEHRLPTPWISLIVCTSKKDGGTIDIYLSGLLAVILVD